MINHTKTSPEIENLIRKISACPFTSRDAIYRFEVKLQLIDPLVWLSGQKCSAKIYFSNKDNSCCYAAIGSAETLDDSKMPFSDAITHIERNVQDSNARYFGGMCFDSDGDIADEWAGFGKFKFVLPRIELFTEGRETVLAVNLISSAQGIADELCGLDFSGCSNTGKFAQAITITEVPPKTEWLKSAAGIVESIKSGDISKLVLARKVLLEMPEAVDGLGVLSELLSVDLAGTYNFCFQFDDSAAFIGASPERLYSISGGRIFTEALAGTALVGDSDEESEAFSRELCESQKEQLEQNFVCDDVESALGDLCTEVKSSERTVVKLRKLQHLCTQYEGGLRQGVGNLEILGRLHPTAAVAGLPGRATMLGIRETESFSRGFYAGPVGYIGRARSEFAVAIRSALVHGEKVHLYAGAGLMSQSQSAAEWLETQNKLQQFLDVLA